MEAMEHMAAHANVHTREKSVRKVSILNEILKCPPTAQVAIWKGGTPSFLAYILSPGKFLQLSL